MTQTSVNVTEARDNLSEILGRVKFGEEIVTIEKKGKPYAVVMSPEEYSRIQAIARRSLASLIETIHASNAGVSDEEVMADATKAVEGVRQQRYERRK